jgi:hypothetical protein
MSAREPPASARNRRTLLTLALLFLLPPVTAFFLYYGSSWRPAHRVNHGELVTPARPLPRTRLAPQGGGVAAATFGEKWSLVYIADGPCGGSCRRSLYLMRQTRLALDQDMARVARKMLVSAPCGACAPLAREDPGLEMLDARGPAGAELLREFPAAGREHRVFVVDPLGNLVMSYDARRDPHGLLEDLKKLLKLSHIG